jgi:hypothetical protein
MSDTFHCLACAQTYRPHWRQPGTDRCLSCGPCVAPVHPHDEHPCHGPSEQPGQACRYCGDPTPTDGTSCPRCWTSLDKMPLADIKALFAGDGTFSLGGLGPQA